VIPRLRAGLSFVHRVVRKLLSDEVPLRASALAFSTITSLVPLLAVISIFVARTLREDDGRIVDLLTGLLPYREDAILSALRSFLDQAESVSGVALIGFVVIALFTFFGVQDSLFRIFGVDQPPSLWRRLVTFSLLFFWGPLLVGAAQVGLVVLRQSSSTAAQLLGQSAVLAWAPPVLTFVGLSMLYWRAAFRRIRFRDAAIGGLVATVAIEALKRVFTFYALELTEVQRAIYGTFAIILFFVLSIQIAWTILLVSAEIAACLAELRRGERTEPKPIDADPWIGLAAIEHLGAPGRPTLAVAEIARRLELTETDAERHLRPLATAGLVETAGGYRLAQPTVELRLARVLAAYRYFQRDAGPGALPERTSALRGRLRRELEHDLGGETVAEFLEADEEPTESVFPDPAAPEPVAAGPAPSDPDDGPASGGGRRRASG